MWGSISTNSRILSQNIDVPKYSYPYKDRLGCPNYPKMADEVNTKSTKSLNFYKGNVGGLSPLIRGWWVEISMSQDTQSLLKMQTERGWPDSSTQERSRLICWGFALLSTVGDGRMSISAVFPFEGFIFLYVILTLDAVTHVDLYAQFPSL